MEPKSMGLPWRCSKREKPGVESHNKVGADLHEFTNSLALAVSKLAVTALFVLAVQAAWNPPSTEAVIQTD